MSWLKSYLNDRYQSVKVFCTKSNMFLATFAAPRGGHLFPLLFSIFVNRVQSALQHSRVLCFADDIKLFMHVHNIGDCHMLQADLDRFVIWLTALGLSLNLSKCKTFTFDRSQSPITFYLKR